MYRLLSVRNATFQNVRLAFGQNAGPELSSKQSLRLDPPASTHYQMLRPHLFFRTRKESLLSAPVAVTPLSLRQRSTVSIIEKLHVLPKKKRKSNPHYSRYVNLLEVTNTTLSERKTKVKRLKAKKLQAFISKTQMQILEKRTKEIIKAEKDALKLEKVETPKEKKKVLKRIRQPIEYQKVNMEMLENSVLESCLYEDKPLIFFGDEAHTSRVVQNPEEVQKILKSFYNFRDIIEAMILEEHDNGEPLSPERPLASKANDEDLLESVEPYVQPDLQESNYKLQFSDVVSASKAKPRFKSKYHNSEEQERLGKERALRTNLNTYLNVCVSAGMINRAHSTILTYRQRSKKHVATANLFTIELYNILLHGFAEIGNFDRFKEIFAMIKEDELKFNEQTFASIFECFGRLEASEENLNEIRKYIGQAEKMGITLNQIMDKSKFTADQREITLDAIHRIYPDFIPEYTPPVLSYNNPLLNHLNEKAGNKIMSYKHGYTKEQVEQYARDQLKIELGKSITIKSIEKTKEFANADFCREKLKELEVQWRSQICSAIIRDLNTLRAQVRYKPHGYMNYYTYLKTLDNTQYADILLQEIHKLAEGSETFSPTVSQLYRELGLKVQQCYQIEQKKKNGTLEKIGTIYSSYCEKSEDPASSDNPRQIWQRLVHEYRTTGPSMDINEIAWPPNVLTGVGRFLYNILMRDIKIDVHSMRQKSKSKQNLLPAFYTLFRNQGRVVKEEVKPHPVLSRLHRASRQQTLTFDSNLVPMLCPPQPWSTPYNGGYLLNKSELIRLPHQAVQQWERIRTSNSQNIYPALDSLNQLASIPWRVNTDVLDVSIQVFQNGGDSKLDVPQPPSSLPPLPSLPEHDASISNAERAKLFKDKLGHRRKQAEMYSLWCDTLYRLSLANHYRDKVFWLPHNMDFRGRVYPVPPHLNHLGSDLARSLLIFDQAQPLGVDGFSWLKLHCINLTGLKKRDSVRERLLYANEIMEDILDSADNPLTGRMWWSRSDEPWQTLACCIEIAKVYRSPNPEKFMSRFPIHQDGSCNGLQHYAALGRDTSGAVSVNLAPSKIPQDVYSTVAALVEKSRQQDADNGLHVAQALDGFVRRKVIKQTVMTTVYGVTRYGARLQISRQLKDIEEFPKDWVWPASTYLTTKTFESLREMFTSTREIQDWFTECARLISGVCGQNVEWCTPLGLPVVQPYSRNEMKYTARTGFRISSLMPMDMYERPNVMKQKNAFPPNFIHSLDSSHMMLTSLHCERKGITFISVHDCFWTHACTVPDMNKICREQFVALHSQLILEDLAKFMRDKHMFSEKDLTNDGSTEYLSKKKLNRILGQQPSKGDFDLRNVLDSTYFFS